MQRYHKLTDGRRVVSTGFARSPNISSSPSDCSLRSPSSLSPKSKSPGVLDLWGCRSEDGSFDLESGEENGSKSSSVFGGVWLATLSEVETFPPKSCRPQSSSTVVVAGTWEGRLETIFPGLDDVVNVDVQSSSIALGCGLPILAGFAPRASNPAHVDASS